MPHLNFETLTSLSRGRIFISTLADYEAGIVPKTQLPNTHPFHALWDNHWSMVTCPGISNGLIDAFLALSKEDPTWVSSSTKDSIVSQRRQIRIFLHQYCPDVILVSGLDDVYSFHSRQQPFTNFICIANEYIDLWISAVPGSENELCLRALLHTCIDHETAHWLFTLVCIIFTMGRNQTEQYKIESWPILS